MLIAGTLVTIASYLSGDGESSANKRRSRIMYFVATGCTVVGFAIALFLVFANANNESRPSITASFNEDRSLLSGRVTASNLTTGDRLALKVDLATLREGRTIDDLHPFDPDGSVSLERAYIGPDGDGKVDRTISLWVPPGGDYTHVTIKAFTEERTRSCVEPEKRDFGPGTACVFLTLDHER